MSFPFPETTPEPTQPRHFTLRELPLSARVAIAAFLFSVGIGYVSALVQLHFQHAPPGELLPDGDAAAHAYHGHPGMSQLERVIVANEGQSFNGQGTMRPAFFAKSSGWKNKVKGKAKASEVDLVQGEALLRKDREGEIIAMIEWIHAREMGGMSLDDHAKTFAEDKFYFNKAMDNLTISADYVAEDMAGKKYVKIAALIDARCARCHKEGAGGGAGEAPLENYEQVAMYMTPEGRGGGMSLPKLAQTTHVHLLGFSMLYGLTGMIVAFTSWPLWLRVVLAPLPLIAQVADISFWWLGRVDPFFAKLIVVSGGIVALGLLGQILFSLFDLFDRKGRMVVVGLIVLAAATGGAIKFHVIDPYLDLEKQTNRAVAGH